MTENMKTNYQKYGECVYIDIVNSVCTEMSNGKMLSLIFIFGMNCYRKLVIFGFAITL